MTIDYRPRPTDSPDPGPIANARERVRVEAERAAVKAVLVLLGWMMALVLSACLFTRMGG